ncbi:hypothetical protein L207DRAFT_508665 [Hyaloscypha variabilis F]|uniref:Uncharacterized protein n=1 Tax=Hyaloscypha variabilis (strain UAMH 11265 / GT02V1 / F) TaxID=1149755 RepID=A0A2J6RZF0_HYAVF|nr:hypothetical protein L207DRAFT_508665 [Hyaloscypha variabilis F]
MASVSSANERADPSALGDYMLRSAAIHDPPFLERAITDCLKSPTAYFRSCIVSALVI